MDAACGVFALFSTSADCWCHGAAAALLGLPGCDRVLVLFVGHWVLLLLM